MNLHTQSVGRRGERLYKRLVVWLGFLFDFAND